MALVNFIFRSRCNMASAPTLGACSSLCTQTKFPLNSEEALEHRGFRAQALQAASPEVLGLQFQGNLGAFQENIIRSKFLLDSLQ